MSLFLAMLGGMAGVVALARTSLAADALRSLLLPRRESSSSVLPPDLLAFRAAFKPRPYGRPKVRPFVMARL